MADDPKDDEKLSADVYRPPPGAPVWYEEEREELSVVQLINILLRHRWKILGLPLLFASVAVVATILWPQSYTSEASIVPQAESGVSGQLSEFSGVASQLGISVPTGQAGKSPQFYADLLTSRRLLEEAVTSRYMRDLVAGGDFSGDGADSTGRGGGAPPMSDSPRGITLVQLYEIEAPTPRIAVSRAVDRLKKSVSVSTATETGVVTLSVTTRWPAVSKQVGTTLIDLVNDFNNRVRQSQASAEAEFVQERLQEARQELRVAEDSLENFLQRNVGWQQSPELRFQHDRLQRRVNLKQQVYTSLATRYEEARISEVKSTPVVTTVTRPQLPARSDSGHLPIKAVVGLVLGGVVGVGWAFGAEFTASVRQEDEEDYRTFLSLKKDAAEDVRKVGRRLRRLVQGESSRG